MIVTFVGHSHYLEDSIDLQEVLLREIKGKEVEFYVGGYGKFDDFALKTVLNYKKTYSNAKVYFITPYLYKGYSKTEYFKNTVDGIIFPEIEKVPPKYAIIKRNEWMIDKADLVIAFVKFSWGGARRTLDYAKKKKKKIINLI